MIELELDRIRIDGGTQIRQQIDTATVTRYAEEIYQLPPIDVYHDGKAYWLGDGFHRFHAARKAGRATIRANVTTGTVRDAILHACGANAKHGLPRSDADKRHAVQTMLNDSEWSLQSDNKIALACHVSNALVASMRKALTSRARSDEPAPPPANVPAAAVAKAEQIRVAGGEPRYVQTKSGTTTAMDVSKIGKAKSKPAPEPEPDEDVDRLADALLEAAKAEAAMEGRKPTPTKDELGNVIRSERVKDAFAHVEELRAIKREISRLKSRAIELARSDRWLKWLDEQEVTERADIFYDCLTKGEPYALCPECNDQGERGCKTCHHTGWISKFVYNTCVKQELK